MFAELQFQLVMRGLLPAVLTGNGNEGADEGATILQLTGVWRVFQPSKTVSLTVAITLLRTKKELGARKSKFDWLDFINKEPKF